MKSLIEAGKGVQLEAIDGMVSVHSSVLQAASESFHGMLAGRMIEPVTNPNETSEHISRPLSVEERGGEGCPRPRPTKVPGAPGCRFSKLPQRVAHAGPVKPKRAE